MQRCVNALSALRKCMHMQGGRVGVLQDTGEGVRGAEVQR